MIDYLLDVEKRMPKLLAQATWHTLRVTYEKPYVDRLWYQNGPNRIYIHKIHPAEKDEVFYHSHPWPSAMRILNGSYRMKIGSANSVHSELTLVSGSSYEMINPESYHSVQPIGYPVFSLMVTGPLYNPDKKCPKVQEHVEVDDYTTDQLLHEARKYYGEWLDPQDWELWHANKNCDHHIVYAPGGGVKCLHCSGWYCL